MNQIHFPEVLSVEDLFNSICDAWESRRKAIHLNPKHKSTILRQSEFILGAYAVLDKIKTNEHDQTCINPGAAFSIMRGEYVTKTK